MGVCVCGVEWGGWVGFVMYGRVCACVSGGVSVFGRLCMWVFVCVCEWGRMCVCGRVCVGVCVCVH